MVLCQLKALEIGIWQVLSRLALEITKQNCKVALGFDTCGFSKGVRMVVAGYLMGDLAMVPAESCWNRLDKIDTQD